jgi:hypothetical protein
MFLAFEKPMDPVLWAYNEAGGAVNFMLVLASRVAASG